MNEAISGVAPPELGEVTVMTVWPSIAESKLGQAIGRACMAGGDSPFAIGKLFALLSIPVALGLFFWSLRHWGVKRYRLTNRRVVIQRGMIPKDDAAVALDQFDKIVLDVLPGQKWYPAGELIFSKGPIEVLRLSGVPHPESFKRTIWKAHMAFLGVKEAQAQLVGA